MTAFLLHGGLSVNDTETNTAFYHAMADSVPQGGVWLGCYFASLSNREVEKFAVDGGRMRELAQGRFTVEMARVNDFAAQVRRADVVYFAGGSTRGLMNQVKEWPELADWLRSKRMVAGSSAGMNLLGRRYVSKDGTRGEGLGLVPFNMMVHHRSPAFAEAHAAGMPPPVLALHETQFCLVEI